MSIAVTTPLSIPQLLDRGFQLFRRVLPKLLPLTVLSAAVSGLPTLLFGPQKAATGAGLAHPGQFLGFMLIALVINMSFLAAIIRRIDDIAEERNVLSLGESYFGGLKVLPRLIMGMILYGLACTVGMILLLIPGFILMLSLSFFWFFIVLENKSATDSLSSSHKLVWGHWWRWAAIYTVALAILFALYAVFGLVAAAVAGKSAAGTAGTGLLLVQYIGQIVVSSIATPLLYSIQLIGFRDLQLRKGGDDLAARIAQAA